MGNICSCQSISCRLIKNGIPYNEIIDAIESEAANQPGYAVSLTLCSLRYFRIIIIPVPDTSAYGNIGILFSDK